jgi:hypothetical protein
MIYQKKKADCWWLMPLIPATWESGLMFKASSRDPISKITRAKWTEGGAQVVLCLLCKCEALSSNPSPTKKENKTEQ